MMICLLAFVLAGFFSTAKEFPISDYGARPGDCLQTAAIQAAIDAANAAGGGEVTIPEGVFRTGGLELKSGVTLHLLEGAILEGSRDPEDYMAPLERLLAKVSKDDPILKRGRSGQPYSRWNNAIIRAFGARDIAIVGEKHSCIDGLNCYDEQGEEKYRGPHAINFWYCTNVVFRGYTVRNSANWAHAVFNSADILAERLTVLGGHDGFDVRTCDRVRVEDCEFRTGDDGVAGFDNIGVVVKNCLFDCSCNALRFGGTDVLVENCRGVSPTSWGHRYRLSAESRRLAVNDGRGLRHNMGAVFCYYCDHRAVIRRTPGNILFRDCTFEGARRIFLLEFSEKSRWCCNRSLSSIAFENCSFTWLTEEPLYIVSDPKEPLSISLKECRVAAAPSAAKLPVARVRDFARISFEDVTIEGYDRARILSDGSGAFTVRGGTDVKQELSVAYDAAGARHYNDLTKALTGAEAQGDDFRIVLPGTKEVDTAWRIDSRKIALEAGTACIAFDFDIYSDADWRTKIHNSAGWSCGLTWYGADGNVMKAPPWVDALGVRHDSEYFNPQFLPKKDFHFRLVCEVPEGAKAVTIGFGRDTPNVLPGERVAVKNSTVTLFPAGAERPEAISPDLKGPTVTRAFASPSADPKTAVRFRILDATAVDWGSLWIGPIGSKQQPFPYTREGDVVTVAPGQEWSAGDHHLCVSVKDTLGNKTIMPKAFRIGAKPDVPGTALRGDGVLLVGGKPMFPIGLFAIGPREANLYSIDRAFADLKAAGINLAHSYTHARKPEFAAGCAKHGLISFQSEHGAAEGSKWFETTARQDPTVGFWYVGDDTSMHCEPEGVANRVEALEALDGTRLTCHADAYNSRFGEYADLVDVFMPEIYPVYGDSMDANCVSRTIDVMEKSFADIRAHATGKVRTIWPIIQYFKGYTTWKRMPTPQEVEAMTFAAIIHGARGMTWYTYGGFVEPEKKKFNYGVCSSAETWNATTNLTRRLSALSPVFVSGDVAQPAAPTILAGPAKDACGRSSVTMLLKEYEGDVYVFAVNATHETVKARLSLGRTGLKEGSVLAESRRVPVEGEAFDDTFAPLAVHIYRFR